MKKFVSLLLILAMIFTLTACKSEEVVVEPSDPGTEPVEPVDPVVEKKVLNLIESSNIPKLVTWQATDSVSFLILGNINAGLFTLGENGVPVLDMAKSYEASADGLTYTFKLREGIQWADNTGAAYAEVTANDFDYAWRKLLDPAEAAQYSFMLQTAGIVNAGDSVALSSKLIGYEAELKEYQALKLADFKDEDGNTAQEQYNTAKDDLEATIADFEAGFTETYGSLGMAYTALDELIANLGIEVIDDYTFAVHLANPVPYFVDLMAFPSFFPANEAFVTEKGDKYGKSVDAFLYNGPFVFKEWKLSERHYLVKNDLYWDAENVALDEIDYRVIEGVANDTVVQMYLDGEIMTAGLSGENVEKYGNRPDATPREDTVLFYLEMNQANGKITPDKELLSDKNVRKAINMGLDKTYITDVIFANGSLPADYFVPRGFQGSANHENKDFREVAQDMFGGLEGYNGYNPTAATELWNTALTEQGRDLVEFELITYQGETSGKVATHIKNELEKNLPGLTVNIIALPFSEKLLRSKTGDFELNYAGWGPDYPDAMTWMDMWITDGDYNSGKYANADYDAVIDATKSGELTAPDKAKERFEALVQLEKVLLEDDQVIVPLYQRAGIGLRDPALQNWYPQSFGPDYLFKWVDIAK